MLIGDRRLLFGGAFWNLSAGYIAMTDIGAGPLAAEVRVAGLVAHLTSELSAGQVIRPVVGTDDGTQKLVVAGDEVRIPAGMPPTWYTLPFSTRPALPAGQVPLAGLWGGQFDLGVAVEGDADLGSGFLFGPAAYHPTDQPPQPADVEDVLDYSLKSLFVIVGADPWTPPDVEDAALARLPWTVAQDALASGPVTASRRSAVAGWHGRSTDPETGAFCIVRSDGPLADLVGERVRVTYRDGTITRSVALYCHDEQDFGEAADEDVSLTRRAMLALAPLAWDAVPVEVEVLA